MESWETIKLSVLDGFTRAYRPVTAEERIALLGSFRSEGTMKDAYFGTPAEISSALDPEMLGPIGPEHLDWTGFPV